MSGINALTMKKGDYPYSQMFGINPVTLKRFAEQLLKDRREFKRQYLEGKVVPNFTRPVIDHSRIGKMGYMAPRYLTPPNWPFMERMVDRMVNDTHTQRRLLRMQLHADPDHELNKLVL